MIMDDSAENRFNTTRRPSFINTEEASQDIHAHLNKWKEGKKLQRIRRDSEMWEEHQFQQRSYSNCSNRNSDKIRTSADSSDCESRFVLLDFGICSLNYILVRMKSSTRTKEQSPAPS